MTDQELAAVLEDGGEGGASEAPDQPELLLGRQLARRAREVMHSGRNSNDNTNDNNNKNKALGTSATQP